MSTEEKQEAVMGDEPASVMTIRERFAMAAMQSISVSATIARRTLTPWQVADAAVTQADALLAALEGRHDGE